MPKEDEEYEFPAFMFVPISKLKSCDCPACQFSRCYQNKYQADVVPYFCLLDSRFQHVDEDLFSAITFSLINTNFSQWIQQRYSIKILERFEIKMHLNQLVHFQVYDGSIHCAEHFCQCSNIFDIDYFYIDADQNYDPFYEYHERLVEYGDNEFPDQHNSLEQIHQDYLTIDNYFQLLALEYLCGTLTPAMYMDMICTLTIQDIRIRTWINPTPSESIIQLRILPLNDYDYVRSVKVKMRQCLYVILPIHMTNACLWRMFDLEICAPYGLRNTSHRIL